MAGVPRAEIDIATLTLVKNLRRRKDFMREMAHQSLIVALHTDSNWETN